jgi:hypothetical protein
MMYAIEMPSGGTIYTTVHTSFMKTTGTEVQAILRYCLRNARGCNVGIIDDRDLCCTPLSWLCVV